MKKRILSIIFILIMMFNCVYVNAEEKNDEFLVCKENIKYDKGDALKKIGNITIKESVIINGEKNYLYPTFDNPSDAMINVKEEAHEFLDVIAEEYSLDELSDKNWEDYNSAVWDYNNEKYLEDKFLMELFFNIYKGTYDNNEIKQIINKNDTEIYNRLYFLLPYSSPFCTSYYNEQNLQLALTEMDVDDAVEYAIKYAYNPNTKDYKYMGDKDCTNFASQILEAGGVVQRENSSRNNGWWHKKNNGIHKNSYSWSVANEFARFWGIGYSTESHYDFSRKLRKGDFIAISLDGEQWNHIGFVTAIDTQEGNYGYYDYCVAQHSNNYHAWTTSERNGWENQPDGAVYGIITRRW